MTDSLRIIIPGEPHAQGRARFRAWKAKDAAKGVLWIDDSQVCVETITKLIAAQGDAPRLEILVRTLIEKGAAHG